MIVRETFVARGRPRWERLEALLDQVVLDDGGAWAELAALYRGLCADLSIARGHDLPDDLQAYLDALAGRAHNRLYGVRPRRRMPLVSFLAVDVPQQVRASWRVVLVAALLFYGPFLLAMLAAGSSEELATQVLSVEQLRQMEAIYRGPVDDRSAGDNALMAGFYVYNNVGIAFRCFATGALAGLGTLYFLVYNGTVLGTVFGHLIATGHGGNLLEFTSGHSAWELNAIVLSGAAGLRMGWSLVATRGRTRLGSLQAAGPELFKLLSGAAAMMMIAAAIEGFWSASPIPVEFKVAFALAQVALVAAWLALGGRREA